MSPMIIVDIIGEGEIVFESISPHADEITIGIDDIEFEPEHQKNAGKEKDN
jgi:hypothetical protein